MNFNGVDGTYPMVLYCANNKVRVFNFKEVVMPLVDPRICHFFLNKNVK